MMQRLGHVVVAVLAPAVLCGWVLWVEPGTALLWGVCLAMATGPLVLAGAISASRQPRAGRASYWIPKSHVSFTGPTPVGAKSSSRAHGPWGADLLLLVASAAATALYWHRVSAHPDYAWGGTMVTLTHVLGFWWPGAMAGVCGWTLEHWLTGVTGTRRYSQRVLNGFVGAALGAGLQLALTHYYPRLVDPEPLAETVAILREQTPMPVMDLRETSRDSQTWAPPDPLSPAGKKEQGKSYRFSGHHLEVRWNVMPGTEPRPYVALRQLEQFSQSALNLVRRQDVQRITVVLQSPQGELLRLEATDEQASSLAWNLVKIERRHLAGGGSLTRDCLRAMTQISDPEDYPAFQKLFEFGHTGQEVWVRFEPNLPVNVSTIGLWSDAWASASNIVRETARYFPQVTRWRVEVGEVKTALTRAQMTAAMAPLQSRLLPRDRVLMLVTTEGPHAGAETRPGLAEEKQAGLAGAGATRPAEEVHSTGRGTVAPGEFEPSNRVRGFQIALVRHVGQQTDQRAGFLYESLGPIAVAEVWPSGAVRLVVQDRSGARREVPRLEVGQQAMLEQMVIWNAGWMEGEKFAGR